MDKMKRVFSLVLVLAMLVGSFSSFSTIAFAEETKKEEVKVEEKKEETKKEEEVKKEEVKKDEVKVDDTKVLSNVPKDVIGTDYEEAVTRLVAFGVIGGYPDGTYKPEEEINRAQFAKIMVMALGLNDAVPAAQNQATGFKDVQAGYWAAGYINVASGQGLLKGYPDGTFRPANKVSYAESLTMLVRSLGYQDEFLPGNWPGNYVAKAADVKITSGVTMPADAKVGAKRGPVAQLVDNTLDAKVVKVDKYKPNTKEVEYYETKVTLLKEKLEISKHENTRIYADKIVNDGLSKDEVSVRFLADTREAAEVRKTYKENDREDFRSDINVRPFIGEEVTTYLTEKDRVIFMESEKEDKANYEYVKEVKGTDKLDLVAFDKDYAFDKKADVYVFNGSDNDFKYYVGEDLKEATIKDMVRSNGKVVVKNNKIVYAEFQKSEDASPYLVVLENDKDVLKGVNKTSDEYKVDLGKDKTYDSALVFDTKGNKMEIKDIAKGNVVYVNQLDYDGDDVALVTVVRDNEVKGAVGSFKDDRVSLGGKDYKAIKYDDKYETYYTVSDLDDIKLWDPKGTGKEDFEKDFDDAYKEEATAYLTATGRIAFLTTAAGDGAGYKYGVVTRTYSDGDKVRIFTSIDGKEGKDQIFKADKDSNIAKPRLIKFNKSGDDKGKFTTQTASQATTRNILGQAVKFKLDKDGEISKDEFYVMDKDSVFVMEKDKDFGKDSMRLAAAKSIGTDVNTVSEDNDFRKSFSINNNASVVSAEKLNTLTNEFGSQNRSIEDLQSKPTKVDIDDFDVVKWENIKEDKYDAALRMYVFPKGNQDRVELDAMVFVGTKGANTGSDEVAVYVTERRRADGDYKITFDEYGKGMVKDVVVDGNLDKAERAYIAKHKSNGKIELFDKDKGDFNIYQDAIVEEVTGSVIKVKLANGTTRTFDMKGNVVEGFEDKTGKTTAKGNKVDLVVENDIKVRVIGITNDSKDNSGNNNGGEAALGKNDYTFKSIFRISGEYLAVLEDNAGKKVEVIVDDTTALDLQKVESGVIITANVVDYSGKKVLTSFDFKVNARAEEAIKDFADLTEADYTTDSWAALAAKKVVSSDKLTVGSPVTKDDVKALDKKIADYKDAKKDLVTKKSLAEKEVSDEMAKISNPIEITTGTDMTQDNSALVKTEVAVDTAKVDVTVTKVTDTVYEVKLTSKVDSTVNSAKEFNVEATK